MADINPRVALGDNGPPDPIDIALAPFSDTLLEVEQWLDGAEVENAGQLDATDMLLKDLKAARKAVDVARDECTKPLHEAWKAEVARWKPTQDDLDRQVKCLVAAQSPYKVKLAAEKEAARVEAQRIADEKARIAREAHAAANAASIEEQRRADVAMREAERAARAASAAGKDTVKGMRSVQVYEIADHKAALNWIARTARVVHISDGVGFVSKGGDGCAGEADILLPFGVVRRCFAAIRCIGVGLQEHGPRDRLHHIGIGLLGGGVAIERSACPAHPARLIDGCRLIGMRVDPCLAILHPFDKEGVGVAFLLQSPVAVCHRLISMLTTQSVRKRQYSRLPPCGGLR